jgi:hypothetical protein
VYYLYFLRICTFERGPYKHYKRINIRKITSSKYFKIAYNVFKIPRYLRFDRFIALFFALFRHFVNISVHLFTADRSAGTNGQRTNKKTIETRRTTSILYLIVVIIDLKYFKSFIVQDATISSRKKQLFQTNGSNERNSKNIIYITSKYELIRIAALVQVVLEQFLQSL